MATYKVTFRHSISVVAENEKEAYETASEFLSELRLDEANDIDVEEME